MKRGMRNWLGLAVIGLAAGCATPFPSEFPRLVQAEPSRKRAETLPANESAEICVTLADSLAGQGYDADAIAQYERARQFKPKLQGIAWKLAVLYDRVGDARAAQTQFELALKETPKNADLLNDVGYSLYNRGKWSEAEGYFVQALVANPKHERACINLGMARAQLGRRNEALEAFAKVVSPAEALANLGFILVAQGKPEEAKEAYREALKVDPELRIAKAALAKLEQPAEKPAPNGKNTSGQTNRPTPSKAPALNELAPTSRAAAFVESIGESKPTVEMPLPDDATPPTSPAIPPPPSPVPE